MIAAPPGPPSSPREAAPGARWVGAGDVVLCNLPPYSTQPWLSMGVVLHHALLAEAGVPSRVVRPLPPPLDVPRPVARACDLTFLFDASLDERLEAMRVAHASCPELFASMVDALLDGSPRVVALSLFRNNADVSLHVARLVKARRPGTIVVLGGPEAIEDPASLLLPFVDVVVGVDAERVIVPLVRALLDGAFARAASLRNVWVSPSLAVAATPPALRPPSPAPARPRIPYASLVPLVVGDRPATMPMLLNWGCPHDCAFCANRAVYQRFERREVGHLLDECDDAVAAWRALGRDPSSLNLQLSDATTNAVPAQFDELLDGLVARRARWGAGPSVRGQSLADARVTEARARRMIDAGFSSTFFGLETASDALRRRLRKPGSIAEVRAAMEIYARVGFRGLHYGVPVGLPGETEAAFAETERFVEWTTTLGHTIESITVLPYAFFPSAEGPELTAGNVGDRRGVLWRTPDPAGDPADRARRMMRLFERLAGRATCVTPFPPELVLPRMLGDAAPRDLDAWLDRHGRAFDQLVDKPRVFEPSPDDARRYVDAVEALGDAPLAGWARDALAWKGRARVAIFRRAADGARLALAIEPVDEAKPAFARTARFNLSYLTRWEGDACVGDLPLLEELVRRLVDG